MNFSFYSYPILIVQTTYIGKKYELLILFLSYFDSTNYIGKKYELLILFLSYFDSA